MKKILISTEKASTRDDLKQFIERDGYEILVARDRSETIQLQKNESPSVVIVDHPLGKENGVDILKELLDYDPRCEVVLVTSEGDVEDAIEALRIGALDYLQKPIDEDQLSIALKRGFERNAHRRSLCESPNILVIEDHEPTLRRLASILRKEGYNVYSARDGEEGIRIFSSTRLDLVLVDIRMPRKGGLEVLKETKGEGADLEVIVITGHGDENIVVEALREGAIDFLKKPVDIEEMLLAIEKALNYQTKRRSLAYRNRDFDFVRDLVFFLTREHDLFIETQKNSSRNARDFLRRLIDALPLDIVVADSNRRIIYTNRRIIEATGTSPSLFDADWLSAIGVDEEACKTLESAFDSASNSPTGSIETLVVSETISVIMASVSLMRPNGSKKHIAIGIRDRGRS